MRTQPLPWRALGLAWGLLTLASWGLAPALALPAAGTAPVERLDPNGVRLWQAEGVPEGCFLLQDLRSGARRIVGEALVDQGFLPCSTYKVPSSLVGLTEGVIQPELKRPWDGQRHEIASWNQDTDLGMSLQNSTVWYHRAVARELGLSRLQPHLEALGWGNGNFAHGVDGFWLEGPFRVTPRQQLRFHARLASEQLPFPQSHQALVRRLITLEEGPGVVWRGKTGLGRQGDRAVGWLVGSLERSDGRAWAYALLLLDRQERVGALQPLRRPLVKAFLRRFGALGPRELP